MSPPLSSLVLYTSKVEEMTQFYADHFGYTAHIEDGDRIVELRPPGPGITLLLHPMGKGRKQGQVLVKLVFAVEDVETFCDTARTNGLDFGSLHKADGYVFANAKDPASNSISVSGRLA
ncbi:VOC family protein [Tateyamaria omphalii]|uniref:Glyoxalase n=1 Tax=Tateyamaria omphalii TaxID=299262 RepID=A0A1P8MZH8_9RHOB|nr:VOC family protein [Tateyamaria omphalii]APX13309.1 glyoxalase [Tateyamaria omphalii]